MFQVAQQLKKHNRNMEDVGLTWDDDPKWALFRSFPDNMDVNTYNPRAEFEAKRTTLNKGQSRILEHVIQMSAQREPWIIYIDGPGGTGKTHVMNILIDYFNAQGKKISAVASSGIASLILRNATTAHARFKIPVKISSNSMCTFGPKSRTAQELMELDVILWDEISMQNRLCVEAVDRSLRDLRGVELPFGGISMIFGGDFRQTLPVVKRANIFVQAKLCMLNSHLWTTVKTFCLNRNVRLLGLNEDNDDPRLIQFNQWLLDIGEGNLQTEFTEEVQLNYEIIYKAQSMEELITSMVEFVYSNLGGLSHP
jgi:hypothetical protein